jgi:hypothetical protein
MRSPLLEDARAIENHEDVAAFRVDHAAGIGQDGDMRDRSGREAAVFSRRQPIFDQTGIALTGFSIDAVGGVNG